MNIPRIVIAASASGVGKTSVTVGLIEALRARGLRVAPFKCGPDYLDPTYHALATGCPSQNLDGWMMGREAVLTTFATAARDADIAVIEGMMGLYDGATPTSEDGSTAQIAKWLGAPVLLVVDAAGIARTVAALALGFARFDPHLNLAGLICNRVGGRGHLDLLRQSAPMVPIVGGLPDFPGGSFPERHLGLIRAASDDVSHARVAQWGPLVAQWCDLDRILSLAGAASPLLSHPADEPAGARSHCRLGVAFDEAFHFYYADNLRRLEALGVEIVHFAPTADHALPEVDGLYFGGGYPETQAEALASNHAMLEAVRAFAADGGPIYAECGGLMYLSAAIRTLDGKRWPMAGLFESDAVMHERLQALGYVEVETRAASMLGDAGQRFRGHQFRYSTLEPASKAECVYTVKPRWGGATFNEGYRSNNVLASYVHAHWASNPSLAARLADACVRFHKLAPR
ncbi:MAG: cobyrinate a,c-diamide synthase [Candidatus Binataceae bacterium]